VSIDELRSRIQRAAPLLFHPHHKRSVPHPCAFLLAQGWEPPPSSQEFVFLNDERSKEWMDLRWFSRLFFLYSPIIQGVSEPFLCEVERPRFFRAASASATTRPEPRRRYEKAAVEAQNG